MFELFETNHEDTRYRSIMHRVIDRENQNIFCNAPLGISCLGAGTENPTAFRTLFRTYNKDYVIQDIILLHYSSNAILRRHLSNNTHLPVEDECRLSTGGWHVIFFLFFFPFPVIDITLGGYFNCSDAFVIWHGRARNIIRLMYNIIENHCLFETEEARITNNNNYHS